jgi:hypothetical protein
MNGCKKFSFSCGRQAMGEEARATKPNLLWQLESLARNRRLFCPATRFQAEMVTKHLPVSAENCSNPSCLVSQKWALKRNERNERV